MGQFCERKSSTQNLCKDPGERQRTVIIFYAFFMINSALFSIITLIWPRGVVFHTEGPV